MGYGNYSYEAHQAITTQRSALPTEQVFTQRSCHPLMNPKGVAFRESRDSPDHPNSMSVVFALDVSGSMGAIPEQIARKELPKFMKTLLDCGVADPQILFMAFQDCAAPEAPLQVGQFESTAELMDQWLTRCWVIGGGASQYESYDLALWFAAHHTKMDCFEKRKKKGYLFMSGDETCYPELNREWIAQYIGDQVAQSVPLGDVIAQTKRTFRPFFLVPDKERFAQCGAFWRQHLGQGAIALAGPEDACPVAAAIVALGEGCMADVAALDDRLRSVGYTKDRVERIVASVRPWAEENASS